MGAIRGILGGGGEGARYFFFFRAEIPTKCCCSLGESLAEMRFYIRISAADVSTESDWPRCQKNDQTVREVQCHQDGSCTECKGGDLALPVVAAIITLTLATGLCPLMLLV